jgi:hypothetical protein
MKPHQRFLFQIYTEQAELSLQLEQAFPTNM